MTATDELRRMLDERGVEWWQSANTLGCVFTRWYSPLFGDEVCAMENGEEGLVLFDHFMTPEQAVEATLGRGECRNASKVMDEHGQARFACSECGAWIDSRMLWNPEYRNGESPWVSDCKLNFCPNCGRRIVGPTTNDVDVEVDA